MQGVNGLLERARQYKEQQRAATDVGCTHDHVVYDWETGKYVCQACGHTYDYNPN